MTKSKEPPLIDRSTIAFAVAALLAGALCGWLRGGEAVRHAFVSAMDILLMILPQICGGLIIAGLVQVLIPRDAVSRWLGEEAGLRGLFIAQIAGALTPGGPFGSFGIVYALAKVGADIGVLITYLTAWTTLSVLRLVIWEIPFLGFDFSMLRFVICLPMGIVAGIIARRLARQWGWSTESMVK